MEKYIINVGMHDGKDSVYYASRGYSVIAFEANPELCATFGQRVQEQKLDIEVRNRAISDTPGDLTFHVNQFNTTWSSLDPTLGKRREGSKEIPVQSCNLAEELADVCHRIHFIKIDIEGYDEVALRQILTLPHLPRYLSVENGSPSMLDLLASHGFDGFKFSNQRYVPLQSVPAKSPHGKPVDARFESSSSGVWGEDITGRWFPREDATRILNGLISARKMCPVNLWAEAIGWFDMHARRSV